MIQRYCIVILFVCCIKSLHSFALQSSSLRSLTVTPKPRGNSCFRYNLEHFNDKDTSKVRLPSTEINVEYDGAVDIASTTQKSYFQRIFHGLNLMYKFSRPHTIKGTILASFMGVTRALIENPGKLTIELVPRAIIGLIALLCGNAYIVGINQIYDIKIDEINKPYLPIAAKKLSPQRAWQLIVLCLITGVSIVKTQFSPIIFWLYSLGIILGTSYSVPPIQLKRIPVFAGSIIAFVRGFLLNFGVYYAVREALGVKFSWNPVVIFISSFMTVFASVIAVTKDLSDIEGDKKYNITTIASKYGVKATVSVASAFLVSAYIAATILPFALPKTFNKLPMSIGHAGLLLYFVVSSLKLNPVDSKSINKYYKEIWNLFYLEYLLYPFI